METLVVNLFAGPGAGKSTMAAHIFSELKMFGINCEITLEFAKELVWKNDLKTLDDQLFVFAAQQHRIRRLLGEVDVVITDAPILFSHIYGNVNYSKVFKTLVDDTFNSFNNMNFFIHRNIEQFESRGRQQNLNESIDIDHQILNLLESKNLSYHSLKKQKRDGKKAVQLIIDKINS